MNQKDSQTLEIFQLGLSRLEYSQIEDLLRHVQHTEMKARPEDQLIFLDLNILNGLLEKLKILGFQEGAKSDDFFFNNNNPY
tara:strand:- start:717 stop:962 length:246 start_codon:yes stop_codon:yes gene_type:complete